MSWWKFGQQYDGRLGHLADSPLKGLRGADRWRRYATDLANILACSCLDLLSGRLGFQPSEHGDVAAHGVKARSDEHVRPCCEVLPRPGVCMASCVFRQRHQSVHPTSEPFHTACSFSGAQGTIGSAEGHRPDNARAPNSRARAEELARHQPDGSTASLPWDRPTQTSHDGSALLDSLDTGRRHHCLVRN